ncbi:MAG: cysteine synthase A [Clostridia bacterium]|nr:cysteine synthase A [Clostridia bacterium]
MIYRSIEELIGKIPLMELCRIEEKFNLKAKVFAKLEYLNPAGSVKDRAAKMMLDDAEERGILKKGGVIIEPTSGNTGIGLACVAASRGYKAIIVMPDTMSKERIITMKAYGAEVVLSDGKLGMAGAIKKAEEIKEKTEGSFILGQFVNPANAKAHFLTTGPEIWEDTEGKVDIFVATVGTGGTITGTAEFLKSKNPDIKVVGVEPAASPLLTEGRAGAHKIQGIGANFIPQVLNKEILDEVLTVTDEDAMKFGRLFGKTEGFLAGISSGAALSAAVKLAEMEENAGKNIVVILPDTGDRYFSTELYSE